jgi:hypothetical protein
MLITASMVSTISDSAAKAEGFMSAKEVVWAFEFDRESYADKAASLRSLENSYEAASRWFRIDGEEYLRLRRNLELQMSDLYDRWVPIVAVSKDGELAMRDSQDIDAWKKV